MMNTDGLSLRSALSMTVAFLFLLIVSVSQLSAKSLVDEKGPAVDLDTTELTDIFLAETKLESSGSSGDNFGQAVAISDEFAVIGAYRVDAGFLNEKGAVYVFGRDEGGTESWGFVKKLEAADGLGNDLFGTSVAISGNTIVVGANGVDVSGANEAGAAYVFERNHGGDDNWGEVTKLVAHDGSAADSFGGAVAIDGDIIAVGATGAMISFASQGATYLYDRNNGGEDNWGYSKKLFAADGKSQEEFGSAVAMSGDSVIIGAPFTNINGNVAQGTVFVYGKDEAGIGNWGLTKQLAPSDSNLNSYFGHAVSISDDTIVVGAYGNSSITGSAYVFDRNLDGTDSWAQVTKIVASNGSTGDRFGSSVSVRGSAITIGAPTASVDGVTQQGASYIFQRYQGGADNWGEVSTVTASDGTYSDRFGSSVSISGAFALIGAPFADTATTTDEGGGYIVRWQKECTPLAGSSTALASAFDSAACSPIVIDPGTYDGCYELAHDAAVIAGGSASDTILDGGGLCTTITIKPGIDATISDVTITGGKGTEGGGVTNSNGTVHLEDVIVSGNEAFFGGGVYNANGGTATLVSSTVSGNTGTAQGGGLFNGADSDMLLYNTTVSGNQSSDGGGMYNFGAATAINVTVSDNETDGIVTDGGVMNMTNTIVAANRSANCEDKNSATWNSGGHNLSDDTTCQISAIGDQVVADAGLNALGNYGGAEPTHALKYTSAALDSADNTVCAESPINNVDQRGIARPYNTQCDIGAYESDQRACTVTADDATGLANDLLDDNCNPIIIPPGVYEGCFHLDHNAEIWGEGPDKTILTGSGSCSTIVVDSGVKADIHDVLITGGNGIEGGGIDNNGGELHLEDVVIADNKAQVGGGIDNDDGGTVVLVSSTVANNEATTQGGGINNGTDSILHMWNSTISSNKSPLGAGVYNLGTAESTNVTIANNDKQGLNNAAGSVTIVNTLLAENGLMNCINSSGAIISSGNNLADDATCSLFANGDKVVADAGINPLRNNGGAEETHGLKHTSPALDSGSDTVCAAPMINNVDQRGMARPYSSSCDIGAFESQQRACNVIAGDGESLATELANAACGPIILPPGTYTGCITIAHNTEIIGDGAGTTVINGTGNCSTISVNPGVTADIKDVTVTGGEGIEGGGIDNNGGDLLLEDVIVTGNTAQVGGGIDNDDGGTLILVSSTVANNEATAMGGGISNGTNSELQIWNSTISSNKSPTGAGVHNLGSAEATNATIAHNENDGIYNAVGTFTYVNTLFGGHTTANCVNAGGSLISTNNNLADDSSCNLTASTDQVVADAGLQPLFDNGGDEPTHALKHTSPAINKGSGTVCAAPMIYNVDQRDSDRPFGDFCDIGAYESEQQSCDVIAGDGGDLTDKLSDGTCGPIILPPGIYDGCFTVANSTEIVGEGVGVTILQGQDNCPAITVNDGVNLAVKDVTITGGNGTEGGGIDNNGGDVRLEDVVVTGNTAQVGGGIDNDEGGTLVLVSSSVHGNIATVQGGGINNGSGSNLAMWNSTISSNAAPSGGGVYNLGTASSTNVTIASNVTEGIYNSGGVFSYVNTLFGLHNGDNCVNVNGTLSSLGHNLSDDDSCNLTASSDDVVENVELHLASVGDNGEMMHALGLGSGALNSGDDAVCALPEINNVDQRGIVRPQSGRCDIGAVEMESDEIVEAEIHELYLPILFKQ